MSKRKLEASGTVSDDAFSLDELKALAEEHKVVLSRPTDPAAAIAALTEAGVLPDKRIKSLVDQDGTLATNTDSATRLVAAVASGSLELATHLLDQYTDLLHFKDEGGNSLLHLAAQHSRSVALVSELIHRGLGTEARNSSGLTVLHCAAKAGDLAMVRSLLDQHHAQLGALTEFTGSHYQVRSMLKDPLFVQYLNGPGQSVPLAIFYRLRLAGEAEAIRLLLIERGGELREWFDPKDSALHLAAQFGRNPELVGELIARGLSVEQPGQLGRTPLLKAAYSGDLETVRALIERFGASADAIDKNKDNCLHLAVASNSSSLVSAPNNADGTGHRAAGSSETRALIAYLINLGLDIESLGNEERTPLLQASSLGDVSTLRELIDVHHANVFATDIYRTSALGLAAKYSRAPACAEFLLDQGLPVNSPSRNGNTPLLSAVLAGDLDMVECLLHRGADLSIRNASNESALHLASRTGQKALVEFLIDRGLSVTVRSRGEMTPLMFSTNCAEISRILIDRGADLHAVDQFKRNALHYAALRRETTDLAVFRLLTSRGLSPDIRDASGRTVLLIAADEGFLEGLRALVEDCRASLDVRDSRGNNVLHCTLGKPRRAVAVRYLLERGLSAHAPGFDGCTPLMFAVRCDDFETAKMLIDEYGARTDDVDDSKQTALHIAHVLVRATVFSQLLSRGADLGCRNEYGQLPYETYRRSGRVCHKISSWAALADSTDNDLPVLILQNLREQEPTAQPVDWSRWNHLTGLVFSNCKLRAIDIPSELQHLPNLFALSVEGCELTELPEWLGRCPALASLTANNNLISSVVSLPPTLRTIRVSNNKLREVPSCLARLHALRIIDLSHNRISSLPCFLASLPLLHTLRAEDNALGAEEEAVTGTGDRRALIDFVRAESDVLQQLRPLVAAVLIADLCPLVLAYLSSIRL